MNLDFEKMNIRFTLVVVARRFQMIHANTSSGSTCHSIRAFQDTINLGDVYYAGVSVPLDIRQPVQ